MECESALPEPRRDDVLEGIAWLIAQLLHVHFSLGGLLIFSNDLQGSIVISRETGKVINYQDLGGGIIALFTVLVITAIIWAVIRCGWGSDRRKGLLVHFLIVFSLKAALIWSIYFSGKIDPRILAEFSLRLVHFIPDVAALALAAVVISFFPGTSRITSEPPDQNM